MLYGKFKNFFLLLLSLVIIVGSVFPFMTKVNASEYETETEYEGLREFPFIDETFAEETLYWSRAYTNYWAKPTIHRYSKQSDGEIYLSKNFQVKQFACKDGSDEIFIDSELVTILQKIYDHFGKAITITSGYRNPTHNANVGGRHDHFIYTGWQLILK